MKNEDEDCVLLSNRTLFRVRFLGSSPFERRASSKTSQVFPRRSAVLDYGDVVKE
jgi:hypothetical protein